MSVEMTIYNKYTRARGDNRARDWIMGNNDYLCHWDF